LVGGRVIGADGVVEGGPPMEFDSCESVGGIRGWVRMGVGVAGFFRLLRAYPWKAPYEVQAEEVGCTYIAYSI